MRLKKIRLAGFKSFVDPTNIPFPGDMTAIVGPNGCGKSNVIDAVRWVLGESSAKNLRGDAMTDVIFNGSSARKPVSQSSVELVFDNSSNRIQGEFAAFNEISVKRVVTKEAVSSYFLNSAKCRRKDITDLFLGTGLGPRSYAIIEQGMISKLIESKPQELRVFIEEAAGISKYKERRKETQNRIAHTKENLDRLEDVRQELGDQIAKLKRQASAATRYKELKIQERKLKSELATVKWLSQNEIINEAQESISELQASLDSLSSSQQGDQSGLQALKNQQSIIKQAIDDHQQEIFMLGSEITKLEQSQLFAKKRSNQIQTEIEQIKQSESSLQTAAAALQVELEENQQKLVLVEPDKALLEEQLEELENNKFDLEEQLQTSAASQKQAQDAYYRQTQELQLKHSQIQQTLSLQERTETRINELKDELKESEDADLTKDKQDLDAKISTLKTDIDLLNESYLSTKHKHATAQQQYDEIEFIYENHRRDFGLLEAKLKALVDIQHSYEKSQQDTNAASSKDSLLSAASLKDKGVVVQALWEYFKVKPGAEKMFESAMATIAHGLVVNLSFKHRLFENIENDTWLKAPNSLLLTSSFTDTKAPNSLANYADNELVPSLLNQFIVHQPDQSLFKSIENLALHEKLITLDGLIYNKESFQSINAHNTSEQYNLFQRANEIKQLEEALKHARNSLQTSEQDQVEADAHLQSVANSLESQNVALQEAQFTHKEYQLQIQNVEHQLQQASQRHTKLSQELSEQQERMQQEEMSLELLNEQVEELSEVLILVESTKNETSYQSQLLQQQQTTLLAQYNQKQTALHEQAMQVQQIRNSIKIIDEQLGNKQSSISDNQEKLALLNAEAEDLLLPEHDQKEKLQLMLDKQTEMRASLALKQQALDKTNEEINDLEKGQLGINAKMDDIKANIQSHQIRMESANVRAQSFIEQLGELKQSLKEILATLDQNADEKQWQHDLDKTSQAITRLGAVNLAAVDEYEEQAGRKAHLDAQNLDLTQALDTLETAMRKIDKETRTRFKTTFEQVNGDLKQLFPKVFGGGMAYLDLTDDDMLDTGVTIMARPPGKKNSTIHLLSGGEKALTALSLVFAIFRLNPAPFCLLDEVDAPLDDANVGRFCRLVSQMSESVQFIYITHNKVAMEMATHLTGVTMAEPGVSRMVAVDMEEALAIAE